MTIGSRELPNDIEALKRLVVELTATVTRQEQAYTLQQQAYAELQHNFELLRRWSFGPRSERRPSPEFDPTEFEGNLMFPELIEAAERLADQTGATGTVEIVPNAEANPEPPADQGTTQQARTNGAATGKRPTRRKEFPADVPVVRTTIELPADQRRCSCSAELCAMDEEVSKELERIETFVVHEIVRKKYACKQCAENVKLAPAPARVTERELLGVGFQAQLAVERFAFHMPYHRLQEKYKSEGFELSRSLMCEVMARDAELLRPICEQIRNEAMATKYVRTDDTPTLIQRARNGKSKLGRMWIYLGANGEHYFHFTDSRSRAGPAKSFIGFDSGFVQADAYVVYDDLFKNPKLIEVACMAHARRYFVRAEKAEPTLAAVAIELIRRLYEIEDRAKMLSAAERLALRTTESVPILAELDTWMQAVRPKLLDKGPLAKAIDYAHANWIALTRFTEHGHLSIDNNDAERALRAVAVGRKNWLFVGNERGGETAAVFYTLIATCNAIKIDPRVYLRDVLLRIGTETDVTKLTPHGWKQHFQAQVEAHKNSILERLLVAQRGA
jgi:transposase